VTTTQGTRDAIAALEAAIDQAETLAHAFGRCATNLAQ
jgi:hypothetical protein